MDAQVDDKNTGTCPIASKPSEYACCTRQDSYAARLPIVSAGIDRLLDS
jgi:hypothetical protein